MTEFTNSELLKMTRTDSTMTHRTPSNVAKTFGKPVGRPDSRRGFTAIEIAMVATVIAILALIVLPLFRNRVEEAKIAAAKADLASLQKAETLAQADTGFYFRLEDLDNTQGNPYSDANGGNPLPPASGITLETPPFVFYAANPASTRAPLDLDAWRRLAGPSNNPKFKGPYTSFQRSVTYEDVRLGRTALPPAFTVRSMMGANAERAPIWDIPSGSGPLFDSDQNRIPVDPWGNPYLFFPASSESLYMNSVIYSLGPNGVPGDGTNAGNPQAWLKPDPALTASNPDQWLGGYDDLMVQF